MKLEVSPKKIFVKAASPEIKKMVLEPKLKGKPESAAPIVASKPSLIIDNGNQPEPLAISSGTPAALIKASSQAVSNSGQKAE